MNKMIEKQKVIIRMKKLYPNATNHYAIGEIIEENGVYLVVNCKTFHFKNPTINKEIKVGDIKIRIFPWYTISYILPLPEKLNWEEAIPFLNEEGEIILKCDEFIYKTEERR